MGLSMLDTAAAVACCTQYMLSRHWNVCPKVLGFRDWGAASPDICGGIACGLAIRTVAIVGKTRIGSTSAEWHSCCTCY